MNIARLKNTETVTADEFAVQLEAATDAILRAEADFAELVDPRVRALVAAEVPAADQVRAEVSDGLSIEFYDAQNKDLDIDELDLSDELYNLLIDGSSYLASPSEPWIVGI